MRWIAGLLLIFAAALKLVEIATDSSIVFSTPLGRYILPAQIGMELFLGILFVSGVYWERARWLGVVLFAGFGGYSLYLALHGAVSCGCFGPITVNPWWTFALDLAVVSGLAISALVDARKTGTFQLEQLSAKSSRVSRDVYVAAITVVVLVSMLGLFRYMDQQTAEARIISSSGKKVVVLEPEKWIGKKLPISDFIDADLSVGEWTAVLHRYDCPVCKEVIPRYEQLASGGQRIALVEVPPYGFSPQQPSRCIYCRLKPIKDWFVQTPVELRLHDGVVASVKEHVE